jgi:hypothetical protein
MPVGCDEPWNAARSEASDRSNKKLPFAEKRQSFVETREAVAKADADPSVLKGESEAVHPPGAGGDGWGRKPPRAPAFPGREQVAPPG